MKTKVVAYIVRSASDLLVYTHDKDTNPINQSGLQVPSGTCNPGEEPVEAVIREVKEESGLEVEIISKLGVQNYDMRPYDDHIHERHFFVLRATKGSDLRETWVHEISSHDMDNNLKFNYYWLPIKQCHVLAAGQGSMLGKLSDIN